jgi:pilus assembly protein CpaB
MQFMGRRIIAIVAALVVALLGVVGVVVYAQAADGRAVAGQATQTVFIAKAAVPMGTTAADAVSQQLIVAEKVVAKGVPQGALTAVTPDVAKLVATSSILPGEIIVGSRFGALPSTATTQVIPAGMIAITVTLADPQRIAPLLMPQSHIVVFDTLGGKAGGAAAATQETRILLADVEVIAVGSQTAQPAPTAAAGTAPPAGNVALVTFAVSPADGQLLVHAVQTGNLLYGGLLGTGVKVNPKGVVNDATILSH